MEKIVGVGEWRIRSQESGVRGQESVVRSQGEVSMASLLAAIVEEGSKSRETDIRKIAEEIKETPNRPFSKRVLQLARRFSFNAEPQRRRERGVATCREPF